MPEASIEINRPRDEVWKIFTQAEYWHEWWGAKLEAVRPGWQPGGELIWEEGPSDQIAIFDPSGRLLIRNRWMDTTFTITSGIAGNGMESSSTRASIDFQTTGAQFADGGAEEQANNRLRLAKLKRLVEELVPAPAQPTEPLPVPTQAAPVYTPPPAPPAVQPAPAQSAPVYTPPAPPPMQPAYPTPAAGYYPPAAMPYPQQKKPSRIWIPILIAVLVGVAACAAAAWFGYNYWKNRNIPKVIEVQSVVRPMEQGSSLGDPSAPVKIIVFSDYQCYHCKTFAEQTEAQIIDTYVQSGRVYYTVRSMGNFMGAYGAANTESQDAAMAAYCAGDQNMFWGYRDALFANWLGETTGSFTDARLEAIAKSLGLDLKQWRQCYDNNVYLGRVEGDLTAAQNIGISGAPSFLINDTLLVGAQPFAVFQQAIETELQQGGQP